MTDTDSQQVTSILRKSGDILLRCGADNIWRTPTAMVPEAATPSAVARDLATAVASDFSFVRADETVPTDDDTPMPFLFDCEGSSVGQWISPPATRHESISTWVWPAYQRVAPSVETIRHEPEYGSAYLSVRALEVLRDAAATESTWTDIVALAEELIDAQPGMQVLRNRINRVMNSANGNPANVIREVTKMIPVAENADNEAAAAAADLVDGWDVFTVSRSGTVLSALANASPSSVTVTRSATDDEGLSAAEAVKEWTPTTVTIDAASAHVLSERDIDCVLVGADALLPTDGVVNKVGTRAAALAATYEKIPVYVVAASDKISPSGDYQQQYRDAAAVYDADGGIDVFNPVFDVTPYELIEGVVTERGTLGAADIAVLADTFTEASAWIDD